MPGPPPPPGSAKRPPPPPPGSAKRLAPPKEIAERRAHARYELLAQLQLRAGGDVAILNVGNVSAGGMLIALGMGEHPGVRVGEEVSVFMDLGDDSRGEPVDPDAVARVVRVDLGSPSRPASIALQWVSDEPEFLIRLGRLLGRVRELAGETA